MNELYSALATGASVFAAGMCIFMPTISRTQSMEDCIRQLRPGQDRRLKSPSEILNELRRRELDRKPGQGQDSSRTAVFLSEAGLEMTVPVFSGVCLVSGVILSILAGFALRKMISGAHGGALFIAGFAAGLFLPFYPVYRRIKRRKSALLNSMPDVMDLLAAATASGLGFDASVRCIAEYDSGPFIQELTIVLSDISHGAVRRDAFTAMEKRCRLDEISAFVCSVIRAADTGISISDVLSVQAEQLREQRLLRAEDAANRVPVKMMIPLVTCIFPSIFIVLLGPAVRSIAASL